MPINIKQEEYIFEYQRKDKNMDSIIQEEPGFQRVCYPLLALDNKWIFPWKRQIRLNMSQVYIPDELIGIIFGTSFDYNVKTKIIVNAAEYNLTIELNTKGLLPRKINKGDLVAFISLVKTQECHLVEI